MIRGTYYSKLNDFYENIQYSLQNIEGDIVDNMESIINTKIVIITSFVVIFVLLLVLITKTWKDINSVIAKMKYTYNELGNTQENKKEIGLPIRYVKKAKAKESPFIHPSTNMILPVPLTLDSKMTRKRYITDGNTYEPLKFDIETKITIFGIPKNADDESQQIIKENDMV